MADLKYGTCVGGNPVVTTSDTQLLSNKSFVSPLLVKTNASTTDVLSFRLTSTAADNFSILTGTNTPNPNWYIGYGNGAGALDTASVYIYSNGGYIYHKNAHTTFDNNKSICWYDTTSTLRTVLNLDSSNNIALYAYTGALYLNPNTNTHTIINNGSTGYVRIGGNNTTPSARLDVIDDSQTQGILVRHSNLTEGIGIGYNRILSTGSSTNINMSIDSKGTGILYLNYNATGAIHTKNNIVFDTNYGKGMVGAYSSSRYQGVFAMGESYILSADGTNTGTLYGICWTHTDVGGQSKAGLEHQALFCNNGNTQTAIGTGIWTLGRITSILATGTSPFAVTSTTVNSNLNADMVDGYHANSGISASNLVVRDANGYIFTNYFNMTAGTDNNAPSHIVVTTNSDNYLRWQTLAAFKTNLGVPVITPFSMVYNSTSESLDINYN
jgi:hypothetical protein